MKFTHKELTELAVKWLKRPQSQKGPGCHVAVSECRSGWSDEIPDAIGFRAAGKNDGSIIVEVKISRSDFLADAKKSHRNGSVKGLGNWRYYLCPEGVIKPNEIPDNWGLLYVNNRGHIKPIVGPMNESNYRTRMRFIESMRQESNVDGERFLLVKLLSRVGDAETLNTKFRELTNTVSQLTKDNDDKRALNKKYSKIIWRFNQMVDAIRKESNVIVSKVESVLDFKQSDLKIEKRRH
ncbi:hypothetical protein MNBD_GAMMA23-194 [hydrothermal vent metagenome]|uniref:Adenylosuccinate synthase n=1 Tax=hydrothermal vent metagenome TaxID=652676 RepID=A0A3B0ZV30_9ZZZZ